MSDTPNLILPLLAPSQAQKHVTVNEALLRLDAVTQLILRSRALAAPPLTPSEGAAYGVPAGAVNAWAGHEGDIAVRQNGGWTFLTPRAGWQAYLADEGAMARHDGLDWVAGAVAVSPGGASTVHTLLEVDHDVTAGPTSALAAAIPANALVFAVTGRVLSSIPASAATFAIGVPGAAGRYGTGVGLVQGAWFRGVTGSPVTYYADTPLELSAEGGDFQGGGTVRVAIHYATFSLPR